MGNSAIIIGSGLGGLQCGVILARHGFEVTVLEQDRQIGGSLQTFVRKGSDGRPHVFDTGFHYVGGLEPGQPLYSLFKYFRLLDLPWKAMDRNCFDEISFADAECREVASYPMASGHVRFAERLAEYFPGHEAELLEYSRVLKHVGDRMFDVFMPDSEMFEMFGKSAYGFLCSTISDSRLRDVLSGSMMKMELDRDTLPMYVYIQATNSFIDSAWRLGYDEGKKLGGGALIADALASELKTLGGKILTGRRVSAIHVSEDGKVTGVDAVKVGAGGHDSGDVESFSADWVISDAHPAVTIDLVDSCRQVKKVFRNRIANLKNSFGVFTANVVLKPGALPYMNRNLFVHRQGADLWSRDYSRTDSIMVHFYPPENGHSRHAGCIDILSPMDWSIVGDWNGMTPGTRGEAYESLKRKKLDECLDLLDARIHGIRDCIDRVYLSSPVTWRSYTSTPFGSAFGVLKDYRNPLTTFLSPRTPLPNLLLTGQSLNLHGLLGVSKTSVITCGAILGSDTLEKEIME